MRPHVVINPRAAKFAKNPGLLADMKRAAEECQVHTTESLEALEDVCRDIARQEPSLVVFCGGDGSAMAGVTHLHTAYGDRPLPTVCLAPGGNSCTVARNWGRLVRDPRQHLQQVLALARAGKLPSATRPTLRVRDDSSTRIGFIFGTGLVASFFEAFYEKGGGGYPEASRMIAKIFLGSFVGGKLARRVLSPMPCELRVEGRAHPHPAFTLIVAAVVRNLGLQLIVPHRAGEDPSRPHLVASSLDIVDCGLQYPRVLRGRPLIHPQTVDQLVACFEVGFGATGHYVLDGDLIATRNVRVEAGPQVRIASLPNVRRASS
jgi:diacylglycerol kinase family enzyme